LIEALDQLRCGFQPKPDNRVDNPGENRFFEEDFVETPAAVVAGQRRRRPDRFVDTMFRTDHPDTAGGTDSRPEAIRIVTAGLRPGASVSDADKAYLAHLVAARTGISQDDAQRRVDEAINNARRAADTARKAAMQFSLYTAFAMLVGAFIAAVAAKIGGHHRDDLATL